MPGNINFPASITNSSYTCLLTFFSPRPLHQWVKIRPRFSETHWMLGMQGENRSAETITASSTTTVPRSSRPISSELRARQAIVPPCALDTFLYRRPWTGDKINQVLYVALKCNRLSRCFIVSEYSRCLEEKTQPGQMEGSSPRASENCENGTKSRSSFSSWSLPSFFCATPFVSGYRHIRYTIAPLIHCSRKKINEQNSHQKQIIFLACFVLRKRQRLPRTHFLARGLI